MKIKNPNSRYDLDINKRDKVLEVGGGHDPHKRANVVVDKYPDSNFHRNSNLKILKHQKFIEADGESLPFDNHEFDYSICCHVLEHVENPEKFIAEQVRVSKKGYIETPSLLGEHLFPKVSHKWLILEIDNKLVLYEKEKLDFEVWNDFGALFLNFLPQKSLAYKVLLETYPNIHTIRYEWQNDIDFLINPEDQYYKDFFKHTWDKEVVEKFMPNRKETNEVLSFLKGSYTVCKRIVSNRLRSII